MTIVRGTTDRDQTDYYETVTSNALERALWLEADRMGFFLPALTQAKLDKARKVVSQSSAGRRSMNSLSVRSRKRGPEALLSRRAIRTGTLIIGTLDDLSAARLADVKEFFQKHYAPNNAFLCLAGDFEPAQARRWIAKYFGPLRPRHLGRCPIRPDVPPWPIPFASA